MMKFSVTIFVSAIFLLKMVESANISCAPFSTVSTTKNCVIQKAIVPIGDPVYYIGIDPNMTSCSFWGGDFPRIPTLFFANFTQLTTFVIRDSTLNQLSANDFKMANKVYNFQIPNNKIKVLKNAVFKNIPGIQLLFLSQNLIAKIGVNAFMGLTKLQYILLDNNMLKNVSPGTFGSVKILMALYLNGNRLTNITKNVFAKNLMLKYLYLNDNQITSIYDGTFDKMSMLINLDVSNNSLTTLYPFTVGSDINLSFNQLKTVNISSSFTKLNFKNNLVSTLSCADILSMKALDGSRNLLRNMNCIKKMTNLTDLNLAKNKFTQLTKVAFANLTKLKNANFAGNLIKKLNPQAFAPLLSLTSLQVDRLLGYKTLKTLLPKLTKLSLTTLTWNCTYIQGIAAIINVDNITLYFNTNPDEIAVPVCDMKSEDVNKIKK